MNDEEAEEVQTHTGRKKGCAGHSRGRLISLRGVSQIWICQYFMDAEL